jgi:hypothetical protein
LNISSFGSEFEKSRIETPSRVFEICDSNETEVLIKASSIEQNWMKFFIHILYYRGILLTTLGYYKRL